MEGCNNKLLIYLSNNVDGEHSEITGDTRRSKGTRAPPFRGDTNSLRSAYTLCGHAVEVYPHDVLSMLVELDEASFFSSCEVVRI